LLSDRLPVADLIAIGSHCVGLDLLLGQLQDLGFHTKFMAVGSLAGLAAAQRGECDLAGIHLLDPKTGEYNRPYLTSGLELLPGYGRMQGVLFRRGDPRFEGQGAAEAVRRAKDRPDCVMVNRNQGSGTRILIDQLLDGTQPAGYGVQARNHNAVAAAIAQGRADWGLAIEHVARRLSLGFLPLTAERYDFVVPVQRLERPAVQALIRLLNSKTIREQLAKLGCSPSQ
jgi:putative molybdopterin biosynthesis protein